MENQEHLEQERAKGQEAELVFETHIKPFVEAKEKLLFEAFQNCPVGNVELLKDIKFQMTAIRSLESHYQEFITTGKLAAIQLES